MSLLLNILRNMLAYFGVPVDQVNVSNEFCLFLDLVVVLRQGIMYVMVNEER